LQQGNRLIVPELSRLGRSLVEVLEVLNVFTEKKVAVYSVKENFRLNGRDIQSKVMRTMLALFA
jgi:DNA invertase Pin-like site-specific DNA recombinase